MSSRPLQPGLTLVHLVPSIAEGYGGPARSVTALSSALSAAGHAVTLISTHATGDKNLIPNPSVDVRLLARRSHLLGWPFSSTLSKLYASRKPDVLHDHGLWMPYSHFSANWSSRRKVLRVVSPRGMLEPWALEQRRAKKRVAWALYQRKDLESASGYHATSAEEASNIRKLGLMGPIAVVPNGVALPADLPRRIGEIHSRRRLVFMSRIHRKKGLENLIRAWDELRPSDWLLTIAGPDAGHLSEMRQLVRTLGLERIVEFVGPVDDSEKWMLLTTADLFVLPSYSENFGLVVAEALGAGVPVITTRGTPWACIEDHKCGWWIETGVQPLLNALRVATAMDSDDLRARGKRGEALVREQFAWKRSGELLSDFYHWLLHGGEAPAFVIL